MPVNNKLRLGILGSGKGSNYRAIQSAIDDGTLNAETRVVIADVESAGILDLARLRGVRQTSGRMLAAWGPLAPCVTSNCTRAFSARVL